MFLCAIYINGWTVTRHRKESRAVKACKRALAAGHKTQLERVERDGTWRVIATYRP